MDALITQIKDLASTADEAGRKKLQDALRDVQYSLETPWDTALRLGGMHLQGASARIGVDLGLFNALADSESPLTVTTLAEKTSAAPELSGRILRYLASVGMVKETGRDKFTANNITTVLANPNFHGGVYHVFDLVGPAFQALPDHLAETKYQDMTENSKTALQKAFHTELPLFTWLSNQPKHFAQFQKIMKVVSEGDWLSVFPLEQEVGSWSAEPDKTLFVDVGGSVGHQCICLRSRYPQLQGRVVLQDLPQTLEHLPPIKGVEVMAQNFFEPQGVKGAKFYYLRRILHDYTDGKCAIILQNLIPALDQESRILIDEMVLPNVGVHWQAAQTDLTMMAELGSKERTRAQWDALVERAGLEIMAVHTYNSSLQNSIMVVGLK